MSFNAFRKRLSRGFTLIELLVVIAIIALLLAVILPALRVVKQQAKVVICASNQRQLVYGLLTYTNDHNGKFPSHPTMGRGPGVIPHRPFELNWNDNNMGLVDSAMLADTVRYPYMGRFMLPYLPDAGVFNCPVSGIKNDTPWPPPTSGMTAVGTYGDFYRTGEYASLHSTYTILWRYRIAGDLSLGFSSFEGPEKIGDKNTLVIQDSLFYTTGNQNVLWPNPQTSWFSSHPFKDSEKATPYHTIKDPSGWLAPPEVKLNAGYSDGHVSRFNSLDTKLIRNINVRIRLTRMYR